VVLDLDAQPVLDGALECLQAGIYSSLQTTNALKANSIANLEAFRAKVNPQPRLDLLFDPQTAGGLLFSVAADRAQDCVQALRKAGYTHTTVVASVRAGSQTASSVWLMEQ